mmetsp:Transcript_8410/g.26318  ORF Transcript_8410/g.26318 Transcript_8410/m.26318 type:complete len:238 (-) Transcript_8410:803-1516(-)
MASPSEGEASGLASASMRMGREPRESTRARNVSSMMSPLEYSASTHSMMRNTGGDLACVRPSSNLRRTSARRDGYVSTTSRTKCITSSAPSECRKSSSRSTTLPDTSGNLTAHLWMVLISSDLYSTACSMDSSCVRSTSFLSRLTTSPTLRGETSWSTISSVLLRMSRLGLCSERSTSIMDSCITLGCKRRNSPRRSSTISFTLLSGCVLSSCVYALAALRTAVGAADSDTSVCAAS